MVHSGVNLQINNVTMITEPFCWPNSGILSIFGPILTIISMVPYAIPFINALVIKNKFTLCGCYLTIYIKITTTFAHVLQLHIASNRPIPECIPSFISFYAIPDPGIVYILSSMIMVIFLKLNETPRIFIELYSNFSLNVNSIIFICATIIKADLLLYGQIILYLIIYNTCYLATVSQIMYAVLYSIISMAFVIFIMMLQFPKNKNGSLM